MSETNTINVYFFVKFILGVTALLNIVYLLLHNLYDNQFNIKKYDYQLKI